MALAKVDAWFPEFASMTQIPAFTTTHSLIDATGEKVAVIGYVVWDGTDATKDIRGVGFRFGTVTKTNGSTVGVSTQGISGAAGPPYQPDATIAQSVTVANANAAFASNTWLNTADFDVDRTVTRGQRIAVVFDFASFVAGDSVQIHHLLDPNVGASAFHGGGVSLFTASWARVPAIANLVIRFSDGTYGRMQLGIVASALGSAAITTATTPDEVGLEFQLPFEAEVDGGYLVLAGAATANFDIVLYEGSTAVATVSIDANSLSVAAAGRFMNVCFPPVTLPANTTCRLVVKPTTANAVTLYYFDVDNVAHMGAMPGGTSWVYGSRTDAGTWDSPVTTRRPWAGLHLHRVHDGTGGGGGGATALSRVRLGM